MSFLSPSMQFSRLMITLSVLLLSVALATRASAIYLVVIIGVVAALVLFRLPQLGLVGLVVSLVVPITNDTNSQTPLSPTILIIPAVLAIWLLEMLRHHKFQLVPSPTTLPLIALAISATVSLAAGSMPWNFFASSAPITAQVGGWAIFIFSIATYLLVGNLVNHQRWLEILTVLLFVIGGLYMMGRLGVPVLNQLSTMMIQLWSDSSMFWIWIVALAFGQLVFNQKLSRIEQLLLVLLLLATFYVGFFRARDWASGWLPPLVAVGTIVWLRSWRLGLLAAVVGAAVLLAVKPELLTQISGENSYSLATRDVARDILLVQIFPASPILGLGPANYYYYTPLYSILGWYVRFNSHNNYLDILMQTGVVGLACFFWVVAQVGLLGWRLRHRFLGDFAQGYVYACLGGLVATLVACWLGDWLLPFVYNVGLKGFRSAVLAWLFLGGLVALDHLSSQVSNSLGGSIRKSASSD